MAKLILERHAFAPELNQAHILNRGRIVAALPAPDCRTIAEARRALFPRYVARRYVRAESYRAAPEWAGHNRARAAAYPLAPGVMCRIFRDSRAMRDAGGKLLDGRHMPPSDVRLATSLVYVPARPEWESE